MDRLKLSQRIFVNYNLTVCSMPIPKPVYTYCRCFRRKWPLKVQKRCETRFPDKSHVGSTHWELSICSLWKDEKRRYRWRNLFVQFLLMGRTGGSRVLPPFVLCEFHQPFAAEHDVVEGVPLPLNRSSASPKPVLLLLKLIAARGGQI